jgi:hypothetical protein
MTEAGRAHIKDQHILLYMIWKTNFPRMRSNRNIGVREYIIFTISFSAHKLLYTSTLACFEAAPSPVLANRRTGTYEQRTAMPVSVNHPSSSKQRIKGDNISTLCTQHNIRCERRSSRADSYRVIVRVKAVFGSLCSIVQQRCLSQTDIAHAAAATPT